LQRAISRGYINAGQYRIPEENIQPASLDLRLDEVAYRIRCSFLPGQQTVERRLKDYVIDEIRLDRGEGVVLETNRPYLIPLRESLALPPLLRGKTNPKSSTGRLDVFTRVITDECQRFDEIKEGYEGRLYLEVVPLSFPVRIREGLSLNQLRLFVGDPQLSDQEIRARHEESPLLYEDGHPVAPERLALAHGMFLSLDLRGDTTGEVGHRARENAPVIDMSAGQPVSPTPYWEPVNREDGERIILTPERFYLLMSREAVLIPPDLASEMTAYDPTSGELRTHYAGFFDPGFGYDPAGKFLGTRAALEVRAHDVPFMVEHGQRVCKLTFERMLAEPETLYGAMIGSSYQLQEESLGKHFLRPGPGPDTSAVHGQRSERQLTLPV
jgi:dCTP deaminase